MTIECEVHVESEWWVGNGYVRGIHSVRVRGELVPPPRNFISKCGSSIH